MVWTAHPGPVREGGRGAGLAARAGARTRIDLCGHMLVRLDGQDRTPSLPAKQGRALFAYLALHRARAVSREELIDVIWPTRRPASPDAGLSTLVSRLRSAIGAAAVVGDAELSLVLSPEAEIDVEVLHRSVFRAEAALDAGDGQGALGIATAGLDAVKGRLLPELSAAWVDEHRRGIEEAEDRLRTVRVRAALRIGGARLADAEADARRLIAANPFRESGYALLMDVQAARGNAVEALLTFEELRNVLREVGAVPSADARERHARLLARGETIADASASADETDIVPVPDPLAPTGDRPFVGRQPELDRLLQAWECAAGGRWQLAWIRGEAGIGKTALAAALAERVHRDGGNVLYGSCDQEPVLPYQPFVEALRYFLHHTAWTPDETLRPELQALVHLVPQVRAFTGTAETSDRGDVPRYALFDAISSLLWCWARTRPLLLVLDDLHRADSSTVLLLRHLLRNPESGRLMIVLTSREVGRRTDLSDLVTGGRGFELVLDGLDAEAAAEMIEARLAWKTDALVDALRAKTDGVPFFMEEALRSVDRDAGSRDGREKLEQILALTPDSDHVLARTVRQVERGARLAGPLMTAAAVIASADGEVDARVLEKVLDAPSQELLGAAVQAVDGGILAEMPGTPARYRFRHALVLEAVYDRLLLAERAHHHRRVGEALEGIAEVAPQDVKAAVIAHHFWLARDHEPERAIRHLTRAGQQAARALAYEDAVGFYRRALTVYEQYRSEDHEHGCDLLLALGRAQWRAGDPGARESYRKAALSALERRAPEQLARAALGLAERSWESDPQDVELREYLKTALGLLSDEDSILRARVLALHAEHQHFTAEWSQGARHSGEALEMARRLVSTDDDRGAAQSALMSALVGHVIALLDVAYVNERRALCTQALALPAARRELRGKALHWHLVGLCELGAIDEARAARAELARLAEQLQQTDFERISVAWTGVFAQLEGDAELAEQLADRTYELSRRAGTRDALSTRTAQLFTLRRWQGRADELVDASDALSRGAIAPIVWRAANGVARLDAGDAGGARRIYDGFAARGFDKVPRGFLWTANAALLAELCAAFGDRDAAADLYDRLRPYADRYVHLGLATNWGSLHRHLGLLAATRGDEARAEEHLTAAVARNDAIGAPVLAVEAKCDYATVLASRSPERAQALVQGAAAVGREFELPGITARASAAVA